MADVIQLLSDHIANQIAAGEVIQRPASAVKELMENSIDAGADLIQLIVKDAGKELIQIIDNGKGMSTVDARMSFERHATSKIKNIDDLFTIKTMGFRGEALASIAAVAQVEMRTSQATDPVGTKIIIEGTEVKLQEPCAQQTGTNIMVKNLFYNVPARRHFLKNANVEYRHILDEFTRIALANPKIGFRLWHNNTEQYHLTSGNLKARIIALLGNNYEKKLVPIEQNEDFLRISGFIGKPEAATKKRGNQFFFINGRFIRNQYLNHAVTQAFGDLIEKDSYPFYILFLETDPARVDVNVHPTKQEVKFEDDNMMYAYLQAAVRYAIGKYNILPAIDFTLNPEIEQLAAVRLPVTEKDLEHTHQGYLRNVFAGGSQAHVIEKNDSLRHWKDLYEIARNPITNQNSDILPLRHPEITSPQIETNTAEKKYSMFSETNEAEVPEGNTMFVLQNTYLISTIKSGLLVVHIKRAMERIWFERLMNQWLNNSAPSQQILFPASYQYAPQDYILLNETLPDLARIGFDISPFGQNTFVVQGMPVGIASGEEKNIFDEIINHKKNESDNAVKNSIESLIAGVANSMMRNKTTRLKAEEQQALIDELFACSQPEYSPNGKKIIKLLKKEELERMLD